MAGGAIYAQQELRRRPASGGEPEPGPNAANRHLKPADQMMLTASAMGHTSTVESLLKQGRVDVNATADRMGTSPLMFAADGGHKQVVALLLGGGADVNARSDGYGFTALHWCCRNGHQDVVELLLQQPGCKVDVLDETQWTPCEWAQHGGHNDIADILYRAKGLKLLAARQRLCLAMLSHRRLGQACPALCLPSASDGTSELLVPSGPAELEYETVADRLIEYQRGVSRPQLHLLHDRAVDSGELAVDGGPVRSICGVLLDCFIKVATYVAAVYAYLSGSLPPDWSIRKAYDTMMRGAPPI